MFSVYFFEATAEIVPNRTRTLDDVRAHESNFVISACPDRARRGGGGWVGG